MMFDDFLSLKPLERPMDPRGVLAQAPRRRHFGTAQGFQSTDPRLAQGGGDAS